MRVVRLLGEDLAFQVDRLAQTQVVQRLQRPRGMAVDVAAGVKDRWPLGGFLVDSSIPETG